MKRTSVVLVSCALALLAASAATWARFIAEGSLRLAPSSLASLLAHAMVGVALLGVGQIGRAHV